jgi:hypothetical protein
MVQAFSIVLAHTVLANLTLSKGRRAVIDMDQSSGSFWRILHDFPA